MIVLPYTVRQRAASVSSRLADTLASPPSVPANAGYGPDSPRWNGQSLSCGAAGVAVLHGLRARHGGSGWERALAWFASALGEEIAASGGAGLWHGAPAAAFALHTAAPPGQSHRLLGRLDSAIAAMIQVRLDAAHARIAACERPSPGEFDLVRGLTGLGAYLLRRDPHCDLLRAILAYLVRLTKPVHATDPAGPDAPGWWTSHLPDGKPVADFDGGHSDQGMAHGISGPLALLAHALRAGIVVDGQPQAIETIRDWLERWRQDSTAGPWWPERIALAELNTGICRYQHPARPSWCYGTPGIARALQLAALALHDPSGQETAENALLRCITDPVQLSQIDNPVLCHGWSGLIATVWTAAVEANRPDLADQLGPLLTLFLDRLDPGVLVQGPSGLIDGTAGVALLLHSIASGAFSGWETSLLLTGTNPL